MHRLAVAFMLLAACTGRNPAACMAHCQQQFDAPGPMCQTVCTHPCAELQATYGMSEATCRALQNGDPMPALPPLPPAAAPATPPPAATDHAPRCIDFIAFLWSCDIGRPARDPTIDLGTQANNDIIVQQELIAQCARGAAPYEARRFACFEAAAGECPRYRTCADAAP